MDMILRRGALFSQAPQNCLSEVYILREPRHKQIGLSWSHSTWWIIKSIENIYFSFKKIHHITMSLSSYCIWLRWNKSLKGRPLSIEWDRMGKKSYDLGELGECHLESVRVNSRRLGSTSVFSPSPSVASCSSTRSSLEFFQCAEIFFRTTE